MGPCCVESICQSWHPDTGPNLKRTVAEDRSSTESNRTPQGITNAKMQHECVGSSNTRKYLHGIWTPLNGKGSDYFRSNCWERQQKLVSLYYIYTYCHCIEMFIFFKTHPSSSIFRHTYSFVFRYLNIPAITDGFHNAAGIMALPRVNLHSFLC